MQMIVTNTDATSALSYESSEKMVRMESLDSKEFQKISVNDVNED